MNTRAISAYNLARGTLLNSKLTLADSGNQPLKLLDIVVSGMGMDPTAGLWLNPLRATPAVPRVFPFDLIYLDKEYRVLDTAEMGPGIDFPAFHAEVASALVLPSDTLHRTQTAVGDHLIVCASNDLKAILATSSLPSPDAAEPVHSAALAESESVPRTLKPGTIELAPEMSLSGAAPPTPPTPFDQSVLTAVARVAETRSTEPKPFASSHGAPAPGPSMEVTEAVLDSSRHIQPAVIEHRIDPEDLFSNWISAAPPAAIAPRTPPPEPPAPAKPAASIQESAPETPKQNGRKSKSSTEARAASTDTAASKPQPRAKAGPPTPEKSAASSRTKSDAQFSAGGTIPARTTAPSIPPSTTFTASPYGIWQVSVPTAVATMASAKSPQPSEKAPVETKQAPPLKSPSPAPAKTSESSVVRDSQKSSLPTASASKAKIEPVAPKEQIETPAKPAVQDPDAEPHRPGDFVTSLQEKLQRAQQARPAAAPAGKAAEPQAPSPQSADSVSASLSHAAEPAPPAAIPAAAPVLRSKPVAPQDPAPAKPKPQSASGGLRSKFRQWLHPTSSPSDRRRAARRYVPGVVAHYFTGGAPKPKNVADISMSGMYLLTDDRWMPGTMIQMTLQKPCASGEKKQSINVLSRIVRRGSDGVAIEFIMPEALPHISHDIQPSQATDKFALARFL